MESIQVDHDPFRGGEIEDLAPTTEPQREVLAAAAMDPVAKMCCVRHSAWSVIDPHAARCGPKYATVNTEE